MRAFKMIFYVLFSVFQVASLESSISSEFVTLSTNQTIISPSNVFELGFFQLDMLISRLFVGVWYKADPIRTCVWVANRDNPLNSSFGILQILRNELVLLDQDNKRVWYVNLNGGVGSSHNIVAELQDTGNLVVKDSNDDAKKGYLWQSFDYPTDTLLPQMHLGTDPIRQNKIELNPWASPNDPSSSLIALRIEEDASECIIFNLRIWLSTEMKFRSSVWDGEQFGNMPPVLKHDAGKTEAWFVMTDSYRKHYTRLKLERDGEYKIYEFIPKTRLWKLLWSISDDVCSFLINFGDDDDDDDLTCGAYAFCFPNKILGTPECGCIEGFDQKREVAVNGWSGGCLRRTALNCKEDRFLRLNNMKLPDSPTYCTPKGVVNSTCELDCLQDCECTAFAVLKDPNTIHHCARWNRELHDMQTYLVGGHDIYIRLAAQHIMENDQPKEEPPMKPWQIGLIIGLIALGILGGLWFYYVYKRLIREVPTASQAGETQMMMTQLVEEHFFAFMEFSKISEATNNFTTELGRGGFGIVYKISDFGMSTTLQRGQTESESDIMVGTYGYMSEEYVLHNLISEKSDIFSFGVTIMEIVTGKKNYTFCNANPGDSILDLSWRKWSEGNVLELLDSNFEDDATLVPEQVLRCVQIGLCCVQDQVEDRPSSDSVLLMLRRGLQIPLPKPLDYFYAKSLARFYANNN